MALEIILSVGELPPPACYQNPQQFAELLVSAMTATATGGVQWQASTTPPADLTMYWLVVDVNGRPLDICKYSSADGAWVRVLSTFVWCADAGSTSINDLTVDPVPAFLTAASAYQYGRIYAFKCPNNTTGPVTLRVSGLAQKAVTKLGTTALESGDLLVGQIVVVLYDGTQFQLITAVAASSVDVADITPGTDRDFLRTAAGPVTQWESGYITQVADYQNLPAAGGTVSLEHGFDVEPIAWSIGILCVTGGGPTGHAEGDYVPVQGILRTDLSESDLRCTGYANATYLVFKRTDVAITLALQHVTTGVLTPITENQWRVVGRAIR